MNDVAAGVEMPRTFGPARRAEWPFQKFWHGSVETGMWLEVMFLSLIHLTCHLVFVHQHNTHTQTHSPHHME